ncbi:MAG: type II toxin-antitoxin system HicB family antitoxin [Methylocella sp.]
MILGHEGYVAEVQYRDGDTMMHGRTTNTRAVLHFAGRNIDDMKTAFADTIADYREWCKERGVEPEKPYSGALSLRIAPELHRRVAEQAAKAGESINQFIAERLERPAIKRNFAIASRMSATAGRGVRCAKPKAKAKKW